MPHPDEREKNPFTITVNAERLANHVLTITKNTKRFPDYTEMVLKKEGGEKVVFIERQDSLTNWVREQAKEIFILCWSANEINLNKEPHRKGERLGKQIEAIRLCGEHLAAIQLCRRHFHLSSKKVKYWGKLTRDLMENIKGWHKRDCDRYRSI